jgi:hypothetical protein
MARMKLLMFPDSKLKWEPLLYNFRSERISGHLVTVTLVGDEEGPSLRCGILILLLVWVTVEGLWIGEWIY